MQYFVDDPLISKRYNFVIAMFPLNKAFKIT